MADKKNDRKLTERELREREVQDALDKHGNPFEGERGEEALNNTPHPMVDTPPWTKAEAEKQAGESEANAARNSLYRESKDRKRILDEARAIQNKPITDARSAARRSERKKYDDELDAWHARNEARDREDPSDPRPEDPLGKAHRAERLEAARKDAKANFDHEMEQARKRRASPLGEPTEMPLSHGDERTPTNFDPLDPAVRWGRGSGMANGIMLASPGMGPAASSIAGAGAMGVIGAMALAKKLRDLSPQGQLQDYVVEKVKRSLDKEKERKKFNTEPALDPFVGRNEYVPRSLPGTASTGAAERQSVGLAEAASMRDAMSRGALRGAAEGAEYGTRVKEPAAPKEKWLERWMRVEAPKQWLQDEVRRRKANDEGDWFDPSQGD